VCLAQALARGNLLRRVRSLAVFSRGHLLSEIMTYPSEKTPQNVKWDEIPPLGVLYPILPPLPPLGSRWIGFSLSILSKQLQSGAIADLEAFGDIFRFWDFGGSGQDSGAGWLYGQLMNLMPLKILIVRKAAILKHSNLFLRWAAFL
jgi:hypothetical protein